MAFNLDLVRQAAISQFDGAMEMLVICIKKCPDDAWMDPIVKSPYAHVAQHSLAYADLYCARDPKSWEPDERYFPHGKNCLWDGSPTPTLSKRDTLQLAKLVTTHFHAAVAAETADTLAGPSGFRWAPMSRLELHFYNARHVQHHVGAMGAFLRLRGLKPGWRMCGTR
jgi:hypothetical protein